MKARVRESLILDNRTGYVIKHPHWGGKGFW